MEEMKFFVADRLSVGRIANFLIRKSKKISEFPN